MTPRPPTQPTTSHEADLLTSIVSAWPPHVADDGRGYRRRPIDDLRPVAALDPDGSGRFALVVVADEASLASLPLARRGSAWHMASPGDGMAVALVSRVARSDPGAAVIGGFGLRRDAAFELHGSRERALTADQSNHSVVVDEQVLVKWRTAFDADGERAALLRRHLRAVGYQNVPPLLGTVEWDDGAGRRVIVADLDGYLPDAMDGWDLCIAALLADIGGGPPVVLGASDLPARLGRMTASLHAALARPSELIPATRQQAGAESIAAWRTRALATVGAAAELEADDRPDVLARRTHLLADIDRLRTIRRTPVQPIHGDLHIGQLVAWSEGLAFIDLDGPPGERSGGLTLDPTARDVAQMLVALDNLAAAVDARTDGQRSAQLRSWAAAAGRQYLSAYRSETAARGLSELLDRRLLRPFIAEQLGRELVYAAGTLPRWRYAPMTALRWRFPEEDA